MNRNVRNDEVVRTTPARPTGFTDRPRTNARYRSTRVMTHFPAAKKRR